MELFLSWKQIRSEMEQELLWSHSAPKMLREIRTRKIDALMKLCPLEPQNFSALMHIIVDIPRWALCSPDILAKIFEAMAPLLELYLSTLTIGLMDIDTQLVLYSSRSGVGSLALQLASSIVLAERPERSESDEAGGDVQGAWI
jgi:hypothetical protein